MSSLQPSRRSHVFMSQANIHALTDSRSLKPTSPISRRFTQPSIGVIFMVIGRHSFVIVPAKHQGGGRKYQPAYLTGKISRLLALRVNTIVVADVLHDMLLLMRQRVVHLCIRRCLADEHQRVMTVVVRIGVTGVRL